MEKGLKTLQSVGRNVSRRSNRGPSTPPMGHSSDHGDMDDSGLGADVSPGYNSLRNPPSANSRASSGPTYHSPSNLHVYSSSSSSSALPSAILPTSAPYQFTPAPVIAPDSRRQSHTFPPSLPSFDTFNNLGSINRPYSNATYCS